MANIRLETKSEIREVATDDLDKSLPQNALRIGGDPLGQIIFDCFFDDDPALLQEAFKLFGISSEIEQTKTLVYYAAPLDKIEAFIRKNPEILLKTFEKNGSQGTLLQLAAIGLDQSIRKEDPDTGLLTEEVIDEGLAERLLSLHHEFEQRGILPKGSFEQAKKLAACAAPREDEKEKMARESANQKAIKELFDVFVHVPTDEKNIAAATATFKEFIQNLKVQMSVNGRMTTNRYHLNLIHLIYCAFDELSRRGENLPGGLYGAIGDHFCFKVIGDAIETELKTAPRVQQILKSGLYYLLQLNRAGPRVVDINAGTWLSHHPSWSNTQLVLGANSYYDARAWAGPPGLGEARRGRVARRFQNLLQQLRQPLRFMLRPRPHTRTTCIIL